MPIIAMMANCAQRLVTITLRLEKRSEIQPAVGAKSTKGRMMMAARIVLISLARRLGVLGVAWERTPAPPPRPA